MTIIFSSPSPIRRIIIGLVLLNFACGSEDTKQIISVPFFTQYKNVKDGNEAVQNAAQAIVRVNGSGTGFFIREDGVLMTNHHVLGEDDCFADGCTIELDFGYEVGKVYKEDNEFYLKPLLVDKGLDIALYQVFDKEGGKKISPPHYLEFEPKTSSDLVSQELTIVGHPAAGLKKFLNARVIESRNRWFVMNKPVLGGNSGSPILNEVGRVVGIVHRGRSDDTMVTKYGMGGYSIGTSSQPIIESIGKSIGIAGATIDDRGTLAVFTPFDPAKVNVFEFEYLPEKFSRRNFTEILVDETTMHPGKFLINACSEQLNSKDASPEDDFSSCTDAFSFVSCLDSDTKFCPEGAEKTAWVNAMDAFLAFKMLSQGDEFKYIYVVGRALGSEDFVSETKAAVSYIKTKYKAELSPPLAAAIALSASAPQDLDYNNASIKSYILNYRHNPTSHLYLKYLWDTGITLYGRELMTGPEINDLFSKIFSDKDITIGDKLDAEAAAFEAGLL